MSTVSSAFKSQYYAGETAVIGITADDAASVFVVYGSATANLTKSSGVWTGSIATDALIGQVNWTAFENSTAGVTSAIAHGAFAVICAGRSPLRDVIAQIDAAIQTFGTNANRSISVGDISISYKTLDELLAVRSQYEQMAAAQESGVANVGGVRRIEVCF